MTFAPTAEQQAIVDAFERRENLVVQAGAGTGKTSTLRLLAATRPNERGLYLAFNKSIADEAKSTFPRCVRAMTAHSLAFQAVGRPYRARMDAPRTSLSEVASFLDVDRMAFRDVKGKARVLSAPQIARHVMSTVAAYCASADREIGPQHVPVIPGLDPIRAGARGENHRELAAALTPAIKTAWADLQSTEGVLRFDHSHYLKMYALTDVRLPGEWLMFDEAQDAAPVIADIVNRQQHMQRVFVGDSSQAIYGFTGAVDAMSDFARTGATVLSLSQSFRFGPQIADAANTLLDELGADLRLTGTPTIESTVATLDTTADTASNAVLCRTNAGALGEIVDAQKHHRKVALIGGTDVLVKFVEAANDLQTRGSTFHPDLMVFTNWEQVCEYVENDPGGSDLAVLVNLVEEFGIPALTRALEHCVSERQADVVVSTAHKAKGREWSRVRIAADFTLERDEATGRVDPAELMLAYVAVTRAQHVIDPAELAEWVGADAAPSPTAAATPVAAEPTPAASPNRPRRSRSTLPCTSA